MIARNPNTGGTIRVLKSEASIWKNKKTLTWKQAPPTNQKEVSLWSRWDTLVFGVDPKLLAWNPVLVVLTEESNVEEASAWLATSAAKDVRFILISSKLVDSIGDFQRLNLGNVMCLEELSLMYPFIGPTWNGTKEDAVMCAALIFRYSKIIGITGYPPRLSQVKIPVNLSLDTFSNPPEQLVLIQQYYVDPKPKRAKELYKCLMKNLECPFVDKIILCMENINAPLPPDPFKKLLKIPMKTRITYGACIDVIKKHVDPATIVVFANTDIYLDETWRSMWSTDLNDIFIALLRWDEPVNGSTEAKMFGPRSDSQDTWALYSNSVFSRIWDMKALDIPFGKSGCDNAILVEFLRQKFKVVNPAMSLRTIHVHQSEVRNYIKSELVDRPIYMHVDPTGIHELNPVVLWDEWAPCLVKHEPLHRSLKATNPKALAMFCSQMNRDPEFTWSAKGQNSYVPPINQDHIINLEGAFVSPSGLVYRHTDLYVGNTDIQKRIWSDNTLSHLIPSVATQTMMAFPLEAAWLEDPALYTLYYLSRAVKQHQETPEASMWCKQTESLLNAFKLFKWNDTRGQLMQYTEQTQAFAEKVVGRTAHGVRVMPADIAALRANLFNTWKTRADYPVLVIVTDDHIKDELKTDIENYGQDEGYSVRVVPSTATATQWAETLLGASRVILTNNSNSWAWLWLAPKECMVLELQEERTPSDKLLHLCAAGGQDWTLLQYPRSTPEGFKKIVMTEVAKWFKPLSQVVLNTVPTVIVPPKTMKFGFFGHKGDSFREIVDMWAEKGYITKEEDPAVTMCWLHGVGQTLLYDRPTWEWLEKASEAEKSYKTCLAGNPDSTSKPNVKPWIFWPRQPRLVERLAATLKPIEDRKDQLVFFGRIENDVQGKYRQDVGQWRTLCSKFSMPLSVKEPYALTPEEYLMALQNSKYGLCLRGYGPKCNREIELLAMGTVPLVTEGVDYVSYADPLIEGLHVIYVKDAEDAKAKMAAIPDSQWETMSKAGHMWWKKNASVDGSWSKTKAY